MPSCFQELAAPLLREAFESNRDPLDKNQDSSKNSRSKLVQRAKSQTAGALLEKGLLSTIGQVCDTGVGIHPLVWEYIRWRIYGQKALI